MNQFVRDFNHREKNTHILNNIEQCKNYLSNIKYSNDFSIFHANIRSIGKNFDEFMIYLSELKDRFDCICLSETWNIENMNNFNIKGYDNYYNQGNINQNDGSVMYIRETIKHEVEMVQISNVKAIKIRINHLNSVSTVTQIYRPHTNTNVNNFNTELNFYLKNLEKCDYNYIIGDLNIDIKSQKEHANEYLDNLYEYGFHSLINEYTRIQGSSKSCLDHIFIKSTKPNFSTKAAVLKSNFTDHYCTMAITELNSNLKIAKKDNYINRLNKDTYKSLLINTNWQSFYSSENPEQATDILMNKLKEILNKSTTKIKQKNIKKRKEWMTAGLLTSIATRDHIYNELTKNPNDNELKEKYRIYKNKVNNLIKTTKNNYYREKLDKCKNNTKKVWEIVNDITNDQKTKNNTINKIKVDGNIIENKKQIANEYNKHYSEIGTKMANKIISPEQKFLETAFDKTFYLSPIKESEVDLFIQSLKNFKSPGYDNIRSELIKYCKETFVPILTHLINLIFKTSICPSHFKIAIIKPLFKSGDKEQIINYRPLSLISNFAKIFEKALKSKMENFLKKYKLLNMNQFGFRQNTSTEDAIASLTGRIYECIDAKIPCIAVFIDLAKAFDTIDHRHMLGKLWNIGFRGPVYDLIKSYLNNRIQHVQIENDVSEPRNVLCGLPQGTVLAPLLFIIFLNNLLNLTIEGRTISFADDTAIFFQANTWAELITLISKNLKIIKDWFDYHVLSINIDKTKYLAFNSYNKNLPTFTEIKIANTQYSIQHAPTIKYLGIIIDSNLKWDHHVMSIVKRLRLLTYKFRQLRNVLNLNEIKIIYDSLVRSILKYGIIAWGGVNQTNLKPLTQINKKIIKIILNKNSLYPTERIYKELNVPSIRHIYCETMLIYQKKNITNTNINQNHIYETRMNERQTIKEQRAKKTIGTKYYLYLGPRIFNKLPERIKILNIKRYKHEIKIWLQNKSYIETEIFINTGQLK